MTERRLSIVAALAATFLLETAYAASDDPLSSPSSENRLSVSPNVSAYRQYAKSQAENLVLMAKALAIGIKHGDLDAAQSAYAPTHRFFKRIEPLARLLIPDRHADAHEREEGRPDFFDFHRIEHGLFALGSTANLIEPADRLASDAQALAERVSVTELSPGALLDETADLLKAIADEGLSGQEEPYSKTDLWDLEANIDGAHEVLTLMRPKVPTSHMPVLSMTLVHMAEINALLEKNKQGCGFRNLDEVSKDDRIALRRAISVVAAELAKLRDTVAMTE